jgi:methylglutaconyl-CoA hydratase
VDDEHAAGTDDDRAGPARLPDRRAEEGPVTAAPDPPLVVRVEGGVLHVRLNRPEVHNALDGPMIERLAACFAAVSTMASAEPIRALLLSGEGPSFCAGADLAWMRTLGAAGLDENVQDAARLAGMLEALNACPVPTVARVQGVALGGAMGLLACCDVVVAAAEARFGFTEAKLGLLPAVVAPYVVARIGTGHARALFATAERFGAERALRIGLVHHVAPAPEIDIITERVVHNILTSAPGAAAAARALIQSVAGRPPSAVRADTSALLARLRAGMEGQEGLAAFLERRPPAWAPSPPAGPAADGTERVR